MIIYNIVNHYLSRPELIIIEPLLLFGYVMSLLIIIALIRNITLSIKTDKEKKWNIGYGIYLLVFQVY